MMQATQKERVALGAQWLDSIVPGWETRINVDTLELKSSFRCICGQVFRGAAISEDDENAEEETSGFQYACQTLFTQAIEWLRAEFNIETQSMFLNRGFLSDVPSIASALGFVAPHNVSFYDQTRDMDALEREWRLLLADRAKEREELAQQLRIEQEVESHDEARREELVGANT
jgi:hypothetical protein